MKSLNPIAKHWKSLIVALLIIANATVAYVIYKEWPTDHLTLAILNVGTGSAIYIESPTHQRLLIDGGPNHTILSELRKFIPFYTRSLDAILLTAPDDERVAGLIDVLNSYKVANLIASDQTGSSPVYQSFKETAASLGVPFTEARRGLVLHLGSATAITILYPDHAASSTLGYDAPIMAKLTFGSTSVMVASGAPAPFEDYILNQDGANILASDIFTTYYGSAKNLPSTNFIQAVAPRFAVISAGLKNQFAQAPAIPVLSNDSTISTLFTFQSGTIVFHCTKEECERVNDINVIQLAI